jgi:hypothetical protein
VFFLIRMYEVILTRMFAVQGRFRERGSERKVEKHCLLRCPCKKDDTRSFSAVELFSEVMWMILDSCVIGRLNMED